MSLLWKTSYYSPQNAQNASAHLKCSKCFNVPIMLLKNASIIYRPLLYTLNKFSSKICGLAPQKTGNLRIIAIAWRHWFYATAKLKFQSLGHIKKIPCLSSPPSPIFDRRQIFFLFYCACVVLLDVHQLETCGWVVVCLCSFPICMSSYSGAPAKQTHQFKPKYCYIHLLCFTFIKMLLQRQDGKNKI